MAKARQRLPDVMCDSVRYKSSNYVELKSIDILSKLARNSGYVFPMSCYIVKCEIKQCVAKWREDTSITASGRRKISVEVKSHLPWPPF